MTGREVVFTSTQTAYLLALWQRYDAVQPNDLLQRDELRLLIEVYVMQCGVAKSLDGLRELSRSFQTYRSQLREDIERRASVSGRLRPLGAGGGVVGQ